MSLRFQNLVFLIFVFLTGCQTHLPPLETEPSSPGPKAADVVHNIQCELARIVNYDPLAADAIRDEYPRIRDRVRAEPELAVLLEKLVKYHFVATAQISLEVTDTEGFTPSLAVLNKSGSGTFGLGGQLTGTQDRSLTLAYAVDLNALSRPDYDSTFCNFVRQDRDLESQVLESTALSGAIAGDLGLADIVADGLIALRESASGNLYSSSGPTPPATARQVELSGKIDVSPVSVTVANVTTKRPELKFDIPSLQGTILFAPQAAGNLTQGSVTLSGVLTLQQGGLRSDYVVNWTGTILPPRSRTDRTVYFSVTGSLPPLPGGILFGTTTRAWGYNPTVNLTGQVTQTPDAHGILQYDLKNVVLSGALSPAANTDYSTTPLVSIDLQGKPVAVNRFSASTGGGASAKGTAPASSSSGGTSFGSLVDFTIVYGLNGSPAWTFKRFKGPTGASTPFLSVGRTRLDSLAITFAAACQDFPSVPTQVHTYWDSIGACDETGSAQQQGQSVGAQNNLLMILGHVF